MLGAFEAMVARICEEAALAEPPTSIAALLSADVGDYLPSVDLLEQFCAAPSDQLLESPFAPKVISAAVKLDNSLFEAKLLSRFTRLVVERLRAPLKRISAAVVAWHFALLGEGEENRLPFETVVQSAFLRNSTLVASVKLLARCDLLAVFTLKFLTNFLAETAKVLLFEAKERSNHFSSDEKLFPLLEVFFSLCRPIWLSVIIDSAALGDFVAAVKVCERAVAEMAAKPEFVGDCLASLFYIQKISSLKSHLKIELSLSDSLRIFEDFCAKTEKKSIFTALQSNLKRFGE